MNAYRITATVDHTTTMPTYEWIVLAPDAEHALAAAKPQNMPRVMPQTITVQPLDTFVVRFGLAIGCES